VITYNQAVSYYNTWSNQLERVPITKPGYEVLKREFEQLKTVERPQNIKAIETARAHGDLSENAEFHAAKERQGFIEARLNDLGYKLNNAEIIDTDKLPKDRVLFGSTMVLENVDTEETVVYQMVGIDESNIEKGRISISSPLGKALLGKEPGDEVSINAPGGKRHYELVEIR
jgi:transcription elongation factor GreA